MWIISAGDCSFSKLAKTVKERCWRDNDPSLTPRLQRRRLGAPNNFPTIGEGCPPGLCGGADMGLSFSHTVCIVVIKTMLTWPCISLWHRRFCNQSVTGEGSTVCCSESCWQVHHCGQGKQDGSSIVKYYVACRRYFWHMAPFFQTSPEIKDDKTRNEMIAFAKALCTVSFSYDPPRKTCFLSFP